MFDTDKYDDRLSELSELEDTFCQEEELICSTPVKFKERRSCSLIDVSSFDGDLTTKNKFTTSTDTIGTGSQGSVCKDSGYIHSESNTSLNSTTKDQKRLTELIQDLKFKNVLISELQESNHTLRLKYAEAENRIAELRLKCESHCDCCNLKNSTQNPISNNNLTNYNWITSHGDKNSHFIANSNNPIGETKDSCSVHTQNDPLLKVKRWQENLSSCRSVTDSCSSFNGVQQTSNCPQILNTSSSTILSTRVIGDRAIRISPITTNIKQVTSSSLETRKFSSPAIKSPTKDLTLMIENLQNLIIGDTDLPIINCEDDINSTTSFYNKDYPEINLIGEENKRLTVEGSTVSIKSEVSGKMGSIRFMDRKLEMERTIREGMNCLAEKGKNEPSLRYRPWETPEIITTDHHHHPYKNKTKLCEITL